MSLDHILLGILRTPASGYEIRRQFQEVFAHFWAADLPQIYRTLNRMERDGLLSVSAEASDKGPERRVYRVTPAGKRAFRKWLASAPSLTTERVGYLAQTYFLGSLEDDRAALEFMRELRRQLAGELETLRGIEASWRGADPAYPDFANHDDFYGHLTLDLGLHKLATKVEWADRCITRIEARIEEAGHADVA